MKQLFRPRLKFALWLLIAIVAVMIMAGTIFAAGEQLQRGATESGGSTHSSNGLVMRDVIGQAAVGSSVVNGMGLCSGFGCGAGAAVKPDEADQRELFMPAIQNTGN